jgi:hypothetical protein
VGVPVDGIDAVTFNTSLEARDVALTVGTIGAVNAELTATVADADDVCVSGEVALSVTT